MQDRLYAGMLPLIRAHKTISKELLTKYVDGEAPFTMPGCAHHPILLNAINVFTHIGRGPAYPLVGEGQVEFENRCKASRSKRARLAGIAYKTMNPAIIGGMPGLHIKDIIKQAYECKDLFKTDIVGFFKNAKKPAIKKALSHAAKKLIVHSLTECLFYNTDESLDKDYVESTSINKLVFNKAYVLSDSTYPAWEPVQSEIGVKNLLSEASMDIDIKQLFGDIYDYCTHVLGPGAKTFVRELYMATLIEMFKANYGQIHIERGSAIIIDKAAKESETSMPDNIKSILSTLMDQVVYAMNQYSIAVHSELLLISARSAPDIHPLRSKAGLMNSQSHRNTHMPYCNIYEYRGPNPSPNSAKTHQTGWLPKHPTVALMIDHEMSLPPSIAWNLVMSYRNQEYITNRPLFIPPHLYRINYSSRPWDRKGHIYPEINELTNRLVFNRAAASETHPYQGLIISETNGIINGKMRTFFDINQDSLSTSYGSVSMADIEIKIPISVVAKNLANGAKDTHDIFGVPYLQDDLYIKADISNNSDSDAIFTESNKYSHVFEYKGHNRVCCQKNESQMIDIYETNIRYASLSKYLAAVYYNMAHTAISHKFHLNPVEITDQATKSLQTLIYSFETADRAADKNTMTYATIRSDDNTLIQDGVSIMSEDGVCEVYSLLPRDLSLALLRSVSLGKDMPITIDMLIELNNCLSEASASGNCRFNGGYYLPLTTFRGANNIKGVITVIGGNAIKINFTPEELATNKINLSKRVLDNDYIKLKDKEVFNSTERNIMSIDTAYNLALDFYTTNRDSLPEGAITSPLFANFIMSAVLDDYQSLLDKYGLKAYAYMDDLTVISKDKLLTHNQRYEIKNTLAALLRNFGLRLAREKTKFINGKYKRELFGVTFVKYNGNRAGVTVRLRREKTRKLCARLKNLENYVKHYEKWLDTEYSITPSEEYVAKNFPKGFDSKSHFRIRRTINKLGGELAWALAISRERYAGMKLRLINNVIDPVNTRILKKIKDLTLGLIDLEKTKSKAALDELEAMIDI